MRGMIRELHISTRRSSVADGTQRPDTRLVDLPCGARTIVLSQLSTLLTVYLSHTIAIVRDIPTGQLHTSIHLGCLLRE